MVTLLNSAKSVWRLLFLWPLCLLAGCGAGPLPEAGGALPSPQPAGPATWSTEFASDEGRWDVIQRGNGRVSFGVADARAADGLVATLLFAGDPSLGSADRVGPAFATEIDTKQRFLYGKFRARLQLAACGPEEEVVNGFFTYFNDGSDANGNGLRDNAEIDVEILCGMPSVISLSTWTDYQAQPERFLKWTRSVDLATGEYFESPSDHEYGQVLKGIRPEFRHPTFPEPETFYEIGFEWRADRLRFFIVIDGGELTLWDYADTRYIPKRPAAWLFNVWHPRTHWFGGGGDADYPSRDAVMRIDWARYWAE